MTGEVRVEGAADLRLLRRRSGLDRVEIDTSRLKYRRLLPLAFRYALWAVRPGGGIVIRDKGVDDPHGAPFEVPYNLVRRWAYQFLGRDVQTAASKEAGVLELTRATPLLEPGWSAGVVFSGREQELPDLQACLEGLAAQPELAPAVGGEILVCGPPGAAPALLSAFASARYLPYDEPPGGRFLIGRKKNFLADAMRGPRIAIVHARIVLEAGALAAVPREFDILAPNTVFRGGGPPVPYLSLAAGDEPTPGRMPRRLTTNLRNVRGYDPMRLHALGGVYVDGGAFLTTKPLYRRCPLDEQIGWQEGEDVEWCARAFALGYVSDLAEDCMAHSTTSKLPARPALGILEAPAQAIVRAARLTRAALRHARRPAAL